MANHITSSYFTSTVTLRSPGSEASLKKQTSIREILIGKQALYHALSEKLIDHMQVFYNDPLYI